MTSTDQTQPNPAAKLLAMTGYATFDEVNARMAASNQAILISQKMILDLQAKLQPSQQKAEQHERRAGLYVVAAFLVPAFPPAIAFFGAAAVGEYAKSIRPRAVANACSREIAYNTSAISQDMIFIQQGHQALAEAHQAMVAVQAVQAAHFTP